MEQLDDIKEMIAKHHGIYVGDDDPVLILHSLNQRLIDDMTDAQLDLLEQYKENLDVIHSDWQKQALDNASRILNASLTSSKQGIANAAEEHIKNLNHVFTQNNTTLFDSTQEIMQRCHLKSTS